MVIRTSSQAVHGGLVYGWISLPYVAALIDGQKYLEPADVNPSENDGVERYRFRGPSLRSLVRHVVRCADADERGLKIKRRFDQSLCRADRARVLVAGGLSQGDAAAFLGVGKSTISRDLADKPANATAAVTARSTLPL